MRNVELSQSLPLPERREPKLGGLVAERNLETIAAALVDCAGSEPLGEGF